MARSTSAAHAAERLRLIVASDRSVLRTRSGVELTIAPLSDVGLLTAALDAADRAAVLGAHAAHRFNDESRHRLASHRSPT
jgi:hypothetical protein